MSHSHFGEIAYWLSVIKRVPGDGAQNGLRLFSLCSKTVGSLRLEPFLRSSVNFKFTLATLRKHSIFSSFARLPCNVLPPPARGTQSQVPVRDIAPESLLWPITAQSPGQDKWHNSYRLRLVCRMKFFLTEPLGSLTLRMLRLEPPHSKNILSGNLRQGHDGHYDCGTTQIVPVFVYAFPTFLLAQTLATGSVRRAIP